MRYDKIILNDELGEVWEENVATYLSYCSGI
jgi:hypothetical protein